MLTSLIAGLVSGETIEAARRARRAAIVYVLAGIAALCGVGFLIGALYIWLADLYGRLATAIGFGIGFVVLAGLILLINRLTAAPRARRAVEKRKSDLTSAGVAATVALLPGILRSAGVGSVVAPALAVIAYAIYRENRTRGPGPDRPVD